MRKLGNNGNIYYLGCGDGFFGMYACPKWSNGILSICAVCFSAIIFLSSCEKRKKKKKGN